jgi:hypothetical protein
LAETAAPARPVSLADIAGRARPVSLAGQHVLPVLAPLAPLFPDGGLRRGTTVAVTADAGEGTTLALSVAAAATQAGSWCAVVRWPTLGLVAASGLGVALERLALVPRPGEQWPAVAAALIDAVDLILLRSPRGVRSSDARRLVARARERGVVLVIAGATGGWAGIDLTLSVSGGGEWRGLGQGYGYLQARSAEVTSVGRGAASRPRRVRLWLPGSGGAVQARQPTVEAATTPLSVTATG